MVSKAKGRFNMAWFGFWMFLTTFVLVDGYFFYQGYDGYFFAHKTVAEKEIQKIKIERVRADDSERKS